MEKCKRFTESREFFTLDGEIHADNLKFINFITF